MKLKLFGVAFFGLAIIIFALIRIGIIELSGSTGVFFSIIPCILGQRLRSWLF